MSKSASKAKTVEKKSKRNEYVYTPLNKCIAGSDDKVHFYAVVLDAAFPHKSFKTDRFVCTLRIADPDQPFDADGVVQHCTLMFFAKRFEDLPIC